MCEKQHIWDPSACIYENGKHLASIIDDSVIICDEIIDADAKLSLKEAKLRPKDNSNEDEAKLFQQILMKRK